MTAQTRPDTRRKRDTARKDDVIQIRASAGTKAMLGRAARLRGQKLSEFMLDSARRQAEETIWTSAFSFSATLAAASRRSDETIGGVARSDGTKARLGGLMADGDLPGSRRVRTLERLRSDHDVAGFGNGRHPSLDHWLRDRATVSEAISARTYVVCTAGSAGRVVGYHAISTAMEERIALPTARLRWGMPDQIPLLLIGRLAVDHEYQRAGLGSDLLSDGLRRCLAASEIAGVRAVVTHAIDDEAARLPAAWLRPLSARRASAD